MADELTPESKEKLAAFFTRSAAFLARTRHRQLVNAVELQRSQARRQQRDAEYAQLEQEWAERAAAEEERWLDIHRELANERVRNHVAPPHHTAEEGQRLWLEKLAAMRAALESEMGAAGELAAPISAHK